MATRQLNSSVQRYEKLHGSKIFIYIPTVYKSFQTHFDRRPVFVATTAPIDWTITGIPISLLHCSRHDLNRSLQQFAPDTHDSNRSCQRFMTRTFCWHEKKHDLLVKRISQFHCFASSVSVISRLLDFCIQTGRAVMNQYPFAKMSLRPPIVTTAYFPPIVPVGKRHSIFVELTTKTLVHG